MALARDYLCADDEPFFVLNSDVICSYPFEDLLRFHKSHGKEGTIIVSDRIKLLILLLINNYCGKGEYYTFKLMYICTINF